MIKLKLDLAKMTGVKVVSGKNAANTYLDITGTRLFKAKANKDGHTPYYLDLVMLETKQSQYGDWRDDQTHMIVEDMKKEERDAGKKGNIIGNGSDYSKRRTNDRPPVQEPVGTPPASPIDSDDCPF